MPPTTYGKRSVKRKNTVEGDDHSSTVVVASTSTALVEGRSDGEDDEILLQPPKNATQKKRRIEAMKPSRDAIKSQKIPSPVHESTEDEDAEAPKSKVTRTYGTPKKAGPTVSRASPPARLALPQPSFSSSAVPPSKQGNSLNSPATPSKLAKRMLGRSKTDTSLTESQKSPLSPLDKRTPSLPILPSAIQNTLLLPSSPSRSLSRTNTILEDSSAIQPAGVSSSNPLISLPAPPPLAGTSKTLSRTYAGRSRSYLATAAPELNADGTLDDPDEARESYSSLRMRWGVDESEDDPYYHLDNSQTATGDESSQPPSPRKGTRTHGNRGGGNRSTVSTPLASPSRHRDKGGKANGSQLPRPPPLPSNMMNPLKSITELRNKGESRRFLDEVAYLLDGMAKSQGAGLIRASALEMVTKLCDSEFFRKAKAADVFAKVYDLFIHAGVGRGDKVLDTLFIFFVVLISKDSPSLAELATHIPDNRQSSPVTSNAKGKGKAGSEDTSQPLVDILFSILHATCTTTSDPLVLVAPSKENAYTDTQLRAAGLGKKEKSTMVNILSIVRGKSRVFPLGTKIGTPLLITHILQSISPSLIPQHHLPALLESLRESLTPLHVWGEGTSSNLELELDVDFENVFAHLRLLDLYLLGQWEPSNEDSQSQSQDSSANDEALLEARQAWLVDGLVMLGIYAEAALQRDQKTTVFEGAIKCLESVLRVLVSVTHGDDGWGRSVVIESARGLPFLLRVAAKSGEEVERGRVGAVSSVVKKEEMEEGDELGEEEDHASATVSHRERKARALDRLCLSLALLTNLVQAVENVKDLIRETYLDPTCRLRKARCLDACSCSTRNSSSALELLVQLYVRQQTDLAVKKEDDDDDEEKIQMDADASFLRGHLAVLFGLLMQGNKRNQGALQEMLPGGQSKSEIKIKLNRLVDQARQFVTFFTVVLGQENGEQETRRLEDRERESSSRVAKEVVEFLGRLRDGA